MALILIAMLGLLMFGLMLASLVLWARALLRLWSGHPLLPVEPRRSVPWGLIDLAVIFVVVIGVLIGVQTLAIWLFDLPPADPDGEMSAEHLAVALFSSSLAMFTACVLAILILVVRGAGWKDLGIQFGLLIDDVKLGATAFVMLAPPMYFIQFVLTRIWPSEHPLQTLLLNDPPVGIIVGAALSAMLVAPLAEEIFFRLIFQGWLEKFSVLSNKLRGGNYPLGFEGAEASRRDLRAVFLGGTFGELGTAASENATVGGQPATPWIDPNNPYASPLAETAVDSSPHSTKPTDEPLPRSWPMFVSAAIFALLHWGHGPDPVPLFFLAVGLGYLYHRTHRILPSITVHFMVNSLSMIALILFLISGEKPP